MITENLSTLKIHKLTQEQYDRELAAGRINPNELYLTPEEELDTTLSIEGRPADAKAVGEALKTINATGSKVYITNYDHTTEALDKTYEEIVTAIDNGYIIILKYNTLFLHLIQRLQSSLLFALSSSKDSLVIILTEENIVTINNFSIGIATEDAAGLVQPLTKTEDMITPVGIDTTGKLWSKAAEVDDTITQAGQAADAAAVRAELDYMLKLIQNMSTSGNTGGLVVEDDDMGNVEIVTLPPSWSIIDDGEGNIEIYSAIAILPSVTNENNGQFMRVVNGQWTTASIDNAESSEF